jgi:hypothetical protein
VDVFFELGEGLGEDFTGCAGLEAWNEEIGKNGKVINGQEVESWFSEIV